MLALFDNLGFSELMVVLVVAILFFGKRLPEVAAEAGAQIAKFRRSLQDLKNETKIDEDLRKIQREIQSAIPRDLSMGEMARIASSELEKRMRATEVEPARTSTPESKPALPETTESASGTPSTDPVASSTPSSSVPAPSNPSLSNEESLARGAVPERAPRASESSDRAPRASESSDRAPRASESSDRAPRASDSSDRAPHDLNGGPHAS